MAILAPALSRCRSEINQRWPHRDRSSDGWIGDAAHQRSGPPEKGGSDHNPNYRGVVDALDVDVDGVDCPLLVARMIRHPAVNYVIWSRKIWSRLYSFRARAYTGTDPHTSHIHVSLMQNVTAENNSTPWGIWTGVIIVPVVDPVPAEPAWVQRLYRAMPQRSKRNGATALRSVRKIQALTNLLTGTHLALDGQFGTLTAAGVRTLQAHEGITVDGIVGPTTWGRLLGPLPTLRKGGSGTNVKRVQVLIDVFGAPLSVDGQFGPLTRGRVVEFQRRYGLAQDGVVGPVTHSALCFR